MTAPVAANAEIWPGWTASGARVIITGIWAARSVRTIRIVVSSSGRTWRSAWVPRRLAEICGPSICKPTIPACPVAAKAASTARVKTSGASVITVGMIATVPNRRWALAMMAIVCGVGLWFKSASPPPFTCKSTNPGVRIPASRRGLDGFGMLARCPSAVILPPSTHRTIAGRRR